MANRILDGIRLFFYNLIKTLAAILFTGQYPFIRLIQYWLPVCPGFLEVHRNMDSFPNYSDSGVAASQSEVAEKKAARTAGKSAGAARVEFENLTI
jgi:hypothetical protein